MVCPAVVYNSGIFFLGTGNRYDLVSFRVSDDHLQFWSGSDFKDYYEAATVDGASKLTILKSITLPLLKGTTTRCLFIAINWAMLLYDTNISLTNGNPYRTSEGVMMNIYATAFRSNQIAFGAAKSILFIIVLLVVSFGQMKLTSRNEVTL